MRLFNLLKGDGMQKMNFKIIRVFIAVSIFVSGALSSPAFTENKKPKYGPQAERLVLNHSILQSTKHQITGLYPVIMFHKRREIGVR